MNATRQIGYSFVVDSFRSHVLEPISTAERIVETECAEVEAERRAFERFRDRVVGIDTVSTASGPGSAGRPRCVAETRSRSAELLRGAFRETVMSVDHYEDTYGETLEEHAGAELSTEVAVGLQGTGSTPFTEVYKTVLTSAVNEAIAQRTAFCEQATAEAESLAASRTAVTELLDSLDGPTVPLWYRGTFDERLEEISRNRQETIQRRDAPGDADGHALCQCLYRDREWTYPVLTAVARFRNSVA